MKRKSLIITAGIVIIIAAAVITGLTLSKGIKSGSAAGQDSDFFNGNIKEKKAAPYLGGIDVLNRTTVKLSDLKGKVVLVNFFATWCPPCKAEIPDIIKLGGAYTSNFTVIGVSVDTSLPDVPKFVNDMKITYPVIMGGTDVQKLWGGIFAYPTSFIIDKDGMIAAKYVGARDYSGWQDALAPYLNK